MKSVEVKVVEESGDVYLLKFDKNNPLTDVEIEEYAKEVYWDDNELVWQKVTNAFILGAKWGRDVLNRRIIKKEYDE